MARRSHTRSHAVAALALALGLSLVVHVGLARLGWVSDLEIVPSATSCRVGELVHFEAIGHTPIGPAIGITSTVVFEIPDPAERSFVRDLGGGIFRCEQAGGVKLRARADRATAQADLTVMAGVVAIDLPPPPATAVEIAKPPVPRPRRSVRAPAPAPQKVRPAPEAASAAALVTAPANSPPDTPTAVSGAPGAALGSGTVAAGGTATVGAGGAKLGGVPGGTGTGTALARQPALLDPDACQDYYPNAAENDSGVVEVLADIDLNGRAADVRILREQPDRQGFGAAARSCFLAIRFAPALDAGGQPTRARIRLNFKFVR